MTFPKDPYMLLSFVNTQLRDHFSSLDALCEDAQADKDALCEALATAGYTYDSAKNCFI